MDVRDLVERCTILRATVGSTVHGLHHGGQDDRDEMAVFVEPPEYLVGLARGMRSGRPLRLRSRLPALIDAPSPSCPGGGAAAVRA